MPIPSRVRPVPRVSARQLVYTELRRWIENGTMRPEEVIQDHEVAHRLGVSRTPVREALQLLEQIGAVKSIPGLRTIVAPLDASDADAIFRPLAALHSVAVEDAISNLSSDDLDKLDEVNGNLLAALKKSDAAAVSEADHRFHRLIVDRASNPYLAAAIDSLDIHWRRCQAYYFQVTPATYETYAEHSSIVQAMRSGDLQLAKATMSKNVLRCVEAFKSENGP